MNTILSIENITFSSEKSVLEKKNSISPDHVIHISLSACTKIDIDKNQYDFKAPRKAKADTLNKAYHSRLWLRGHSKSISPAYHRFLTPPCHTLSPLALTHPPPLATNQIVTNFEAIMSRSLMQILDLIFAKMCIFSTQTLLSTWNATLKSR